MTIRFASRMAAVAAAALIGICAALPLPSRTMATAGQVAATSLMGIAALKGQLNLNTSQQAMWDNAVAAGQAARDSARASHQKVHDTLTAELAKAEPDLAAVAAATDAARDSAATQHRQVRGCVAQSLRHVHARPEDGGEERAATEADADGAVPREDAPASRGLNSGVGLRRVARANLTGAAGYRSRPCQR